MESYKKYALKDGNFFGTVGSPTFLLALRTYLDSLDSLSLTNELEIYHFLLSFHEDLKEHHFFSGGTGEDSDFESIGITMLVANEHGIFSTYDYREVVNHKRFYAIGSGSEYALGAMTLAARTVNDSKSIVEAGLYAASKHDLHTDEHWEFGTV